MPVKKAAFKHLRQTEKRTLKNKKVKENIKFLTKKCDKAIEAKVKEKAQELVKSIIKSIDKAIQQGILKKNTGARKKSRLMTKVNKLDKSTKKEGK